MAIVIQKLKYAKLYEISSNESLKMLIHKISIKQNIYFIFMKVYFKAIFGY